jgi:lysyl-tRNA synthetase, class II
MSTARDFTEAERAHRLAKIEALRRHGVNPYPPSFARDHSAADVRGRFAGLSADTVTDTVVRVAGRLMLIRRHGGLVFADLKDQTGTIQLLASREVLGAGPFGDVEALDRGDWVGVVGTVMTTRTGELSVRAQQLELLTKSLRALPDKRRGLTDVDTRLRERYLDLIVNPHSRRIFEIRSAVVASVRATLVRRGFVEVETPVLDAQAGGAAARPFITHHNALDIDMFMRIALELPLKRLVVGGFERVFEIGRVFRNEGLDTRHNPEFTLLEAYQALGDYHDMMELVETIASQAALAATGSMQIELGGRPVDLKPPWRRVTMADLIEQRTGARMHPSMPIAQAREICDRVGVQYESGWGAGRLMSEVYDETAEGTLLEPTFVYDYPREVSPLARTHREDASMVERFEAVVGGRELANAYSELNDPVDQRGRFEAEAAAKAAGDEEAESLDEDYIRALEYGLPPTGGLGIGIDRLVMLIARAPAIREVILFPTMRPEAGTAGRTARRPLSSRGVPTAAAMASPAAGVPAETGPGPEPAPQPETGPGPEPEPQPEPGPQPEPTRSPPAPDYEAATSDRATARLLAWLTAIGGLVYLLALLPGVHGRLGLREFLHDVTGQVTVRVASVIVGVVLVLVALQLARRKQRAWFVAVVFFALAAADHVLKGPHPIVVLYSVAMLVALIWHRDVFTAQPDPGSLLDVVRFVPIYLALVFGFGAVTLILESDHVRERITVGGILETIVLGLVGIDGPYHYTGRFFAHFFPAALLALGIAGLVIVFVLVFRAVRVRQGPSAADRRRAATLVHAYGWDTLDYFALRPDKSYFFSTAGDAMIAFAYVSGYALVSADPIGAPGSKERVLDEFLGYCRRHAWHVAFLAVRESDMPLYRERGLRGIYLGDEAIVRCDRFTVSGSAMKSVRSAVTRVGRHCTFRLMRETDASPQLCAELNDIRARWRGKAPERGFTMELGGGVRGANPDFLLAIASGADGRPLGFLRLVPCFGEDPGWSLDLMQRDPDAPNGITEYLIANTALALGERGFSRLSMNFAAWGRLFEEGARLSLFQRLLRRVATVLNPFFQIKSLRDFNAKFDPDWSPRSIVMEAAESMPKVGLLFASVEGFLTIPLIGSRLVPPLRAGAAQGADSGVSPR